MMNAPTMNLMTKTKPEASNFSRRKTYLDRKSTDEDRLQDKLVPLYESLYDKIKEHAKSQGIPAYEAMAHAMRGYLQKAGYFVPEIGEVSPDEKTLLEETLYIYRNRQSNPFFNEAISVIQSLIRVANRTKI